MCEDSNSAGEYLAVEEKSLNKSAENVRDTKGVEEIVSQIKAILEAKGLLENKTYFFHLEFSKAPRSTEKRMYAEKVAESVENALALDHDATTNHPISLELEGCNCVDEFGLYSVYRDQRVLFSFGVDSSFSKDLHADRVNALTRIVERGNSKLQIARDEGKRTTLLISNNFILFDGRSIREAMLDLEQKRHGHIEEIYFANKRSFEDRYDISQIK